MLVSALALLAMAAARPASMSVAEFLAKADALQRQGMLATFSSEARLIKSEAKLDVNSFAAELIAATKAHRTPPACPPKVGNAFKFTVASDELLQYYRSLPPQQRSISSRDGFAAFMAKKYPCRG